MSFESFPAADRTRIIVGLTTEQEVARRLRLDGALGGGEIPERDTTMFGEDEVIHNLDGDMYDRNVSLYLAATELGAMNAGSGFKAENDVSSLEAMPAVLPAAAGERALVGASVTNA